MDKLILSSVEDFIQKQGEKLGVSNWLLINQKMIDKFADATLDHQWIHVDEDRARRDSATSSTIAQGYLTLSLVIYLLESVFELKNVTQVINYGIDKFSFINPVMVNSRVRLHVSLKTAWDIKTTCMAKMHCQMEIENQEKPAFEGLITLVYYFKN